MQLVQSAVFQSLKSKDILRRLFLLKFCSVKILSNHVEQIVKTSQLVLGHSLFKKIFKPLVYDIYVAGETEEEIKDSMMKLQEKKLIPFLSPMLEDVPGLNISMEETENLHQRNFNKIQHCIEMVAKYLKQDRAIAIKLTAFFPTTILSKIALNVSKTDINAEMLDSYLIQMKSQDSEMFKACQRLLAIADQCQSLKVNLYIDAEYSHLQPAVRLLTLCLMTNYNSNTNGPFIYNTYQCYLKDSLIDLKNDLKLSKSLNMALACKLVRGAYLNIERKQGGNHCPVHETYEATNLSYDTAVQICLENSCIVKTTIATHNLSSVKNALALMETDLKKSSVYFAQINGLGDHISLSLAGQEQAKVLKLLPCGTFDEVFAWLIRRLQENSVAFERVQTEQKLLRQELYHRFLFRI